jgi:hypothetical protein
VARVARQKRQGLDLGMGADEEVRQDAGARAATFAVGLEGFAGEEEGWLGDLDDTDLGGSQEAIDLLDVEETD